MLLQQPCRFNIKTLYWKLWLKLMSQLFDADIPDALASFVLVIG